MPRFAANLSMMYTEVPFPERFSAAAADGFQAVEYLFPYSWTPAQLAGWLQTALALQCSAIVAHHPMYSTQTVARIQAAGLRCLCYTVNDEQAARALQALGTDGIITDRVDLFSPDAVPVGRGKSAPA